MCCRNGPRRTPIVVVLGKLAYEKYQEHKAEKQAIARGSSQTPNYQSIQQHALPYEANVEIMEKAGISPPSYNEVIVSSRAVIPAERDVLQLKTDGLEEKQQLYGEDIDRNVILPSATESLDGDLSDEDLEAAQAEFVKKWKARHAGKEARGQEVSRGECRRGGWEQKKAARAARKAERRARGGCCC